MEIAVDEKECQLDKGKIGRKVYMQRKKHMQKSGREKER